MTRLEDQAGEISAQDFLFGGRSVSSDVLRDGDGMVLEGRLLLTNFGIGIELDDGTIWHLDVETRVQSFIGQRVIVRGIRSAVDRLRVELIEQG